MYKVLLVDDEILVREAMSENIDWNKMGYQLVGDCPDGKAAIAFLQKNEVDLVLTDIFMPYIDGMELSRYIFENMPEKLVVVFSGYGEFEYAKKAMQYNVSEYLLKPITARELSECLIRIHDKLDSLSAQKEQMHKLSKIYQSYTKNESIIVSKRLTELVKGTVDTEKTLSELEDMNISILGAYYRVGVISIDPDASTLFGEMQQKDMDLMSFVVENISHEVVYDAGAGLAFRDSEQVVYIIFKTNKMHEFKINVTKLCKEIQKHTREFMDITVSISVGPYVTRIEDLSTSFQIAERNLDYEFAKGRGFLFDAEAKLSIKPLPEPPIKALIRQVQWGREEEVDGLLDSFAFKLQDGIFEKEQIRSVLGQLLFAIGDALVVLEPEEELSENRNHFTSLLAAAKSMPEGMDVVRGYAKKAMDSFTQAGNSSGNRQAMLAMNYLKEHYGEPSISLNDICGYLNISTSHFSNIFKEATGLTFMEALTTIRMDKAKQLLRDTNLKNYEIAERVGFSDPHYFNIAFKKMVGYTPKEYAREKK